MLPFGRPGHGPDVSCIIRKRIDAFLSAALILVFLDVIWSLALGAAAPAGYVLVLGFQLAAGLTAASITSLVAAGLSRMGPWSRYPRVTSPLYYAAAASLLLIGAAALPRAPSASLAALVATGIAMALASRVILRRARPPSTLPYAVGSLAASGLFWVVCDALQLFERMGSKSISLWLLVFLAAAIGAHAFSFVIGTLLSDRNRPVPALLSVACAASGAVLAILPTVLFPARYPTIRTVTYVLALLLLALAFLGHELRVPHLRKSAVALTMGCVAYVVGFLHPLGSTFHHLAFRSLTSQPIVRETGILRYSMRRYLSSLSRISTPPAGRLELARWNDHAPIQSVVLITVDTLRYDHTGYSGLAPEGLTPSMDRLASRAQRFHRAYPQGGLTSLSIPSLMWSRHPKDIEFVPLQCDAEHNLFFLEEVPSDAVLHFTFQSPLHQPTPNLAEVLTENGWRTECVPNDGFTQYFHPRLGFTRGFERIVYPRREATRRLKQNPGDAPMPTDELAVELAIEVLEGLGDQRHFLWLHLFEPHKPYGTHPDQRFTGYEGEVHYTDRQLGRLLDALEGSGQLDRALIILTADHGESLGERGTDGHGLDLYDTSLRVPLLLSIPGIEPRDHDGEVGLIDLAPTILELLDVPAPTGFQGRSLYGDAGPSHPVFTETWQNRGAAGARNLHLIGAISHRKKVIYDARRHGFLFSDLATDPEENHPVLVGDTRHRVWADWLVQELVQWHEVLGDWASK